jgi:hypothetical protein
MTKGSDGVVVILIAIIAILEGQFTRSPINGVGMGAIPGEHQ